MRKLLFPIFACMALISGCVRKQGEELVVRYAFWGSNKQQEIEQNVVKAFETENPGIRIELVPIGGSRYAEKIQAMMVGQVAPDVLMVEMNQYLEWAARGALLNVTSDVQALTEGNPLMPLPAKAFEADGGYFAVPINCSGYAMYLNLDALRTGGVSADELRTWNDLLRLAPRLSRHSKLARNSGAPTDYALLMPPPLIVFWAFGGEMFDDPFRPTRVTVRSSQAGAALGFLRAMYASGYAAPPDVSADQGTYQLFRDGKVAIYFDGRWRTPELDGRTAFRWDVRPMPAGPAGQVTLHGGTGLAISKTSRQQEAARKFIRFYASEMGSAIAASGGRSVPVYRKLAYDESFLGLHPPDHIRVFSETMEAEASRLSVYCAGSSQVRDLFGARVEQALVEPERPLEEILTGLEADLNRWLERQKKKGLF